MKIATGTIVGLAILAVAAIRATRMATRVRRGPDGKPATRDEARGTWPTFVAAFERRKPGEFFSAKAPFRDGTRLQYMWLRVTAIEHDRIFGMLDNEPGTVRNVNLGQKVSFPLSELNDWIYKGASGSIHGGLTANAIMGHPRE